MPSEKQRTIEDQAARNRRGRELSNRMKARYGSIYRRMMVFVLDDHLGGPKKSWELTFAELADECEMSERHAYRTAEELRAMGLIDFEETELNSGVYRFRIIRTNVAELAEESGQVPPRRKRGRPKKGAKKSCLSVKTSDSQSKPLTGGQNPCLSVKTSDSQANALLVERQRTPTTPSTPAGEPPATWELVEEEILAVGIQEAEKPIAKMRETGCRPDQALTVLRFWRRFPGRWSLGKLRRRLINLRPSQSCEDLTYWPPEDEGWQRKSEGNTERISLTGDEIRDLVEWILSQDLRPEQRERWEGIAADEETLADAAHAMVVYRQPLEAAYRKRQEILAATDCHG